MVTQSRTETLTTLFSCVSNPGSMQQTSLEGAPIYAWEIGCVGQIAEATSYKRVQCFTGNCRGQSYYRAKQPSQVAYCPYNVCCEARHAIVHESRRAHNPVVLLYWLIGTPLKALSLLHLVQSSQARVGLFSIAVPQSQQVAGTNVHCGGNQRTVPGICWLE